MTLKNERKQLRQKLEKEYGLKATRKTVTLRTNIKCMNLNVPNYKPEKGQLNRQVDATRWTG